MLCTVCSIAHSIDENLFAEIVKANKIHKSTPKKNHPKKDPIITDRNNLLGSPMPVKGSVYFSEGNISSDRARFYVKQLLDIYGITDRCQLFVRSR